jgi:methanogenic corrinoid protein MtbC1
MGESREDKSGESHQEKVNELAGAYAAALLSGDEVAAEIAIRQAMDANLNTPEIDEDVIAPAMWLVGELWEQGEISVADEHLATEITLRVLSLQREVQRAARARSRFRVMLAAPAGELHVVALRMVANLLVDSGYDTMMLGADVPADALAAAARRHGVEVICMSSTMPGQMCQVLSAIDEVRRELPSAGFVVGGRGLTVERQLRPQVHACPRASEVVDVVDAMVQGAGRN